MTRDLPIAIIAGYVGRSHEPTGKQATNSAAVIRGGKVLMRQTKVLLPTYDVFDEARNFVAADSQSVWKTDHGAQAEGSVVRDQSIDIALTICEDAWNDKQFWPRQLYGRDPVDELIRQGGRMIVSINGSPFHLGKRALREEMFRAMVRRHNVPAHGKRYHHHGFHMKNFHQWRIN